jgi:hypothetical protein
MQKILLSLILLSSFLYAEGYSREDRIKDMQDMAEAMNTIQSGFFYNNYDTVVSGVEHLTSSIERVSPPLEELEETDIMTRYMNNKIQMTRKVVKKINQKSLTILQRFKSGDPVQAVQAYKKILEQCVACHQQTRNW